VKKYLNGYIRSSMVADKIDEYILPPALGNRSGALGAIAMAIQSTARMKQTVARSP
jgi:fructokinase